MSLKRKREDCASGAVCESCKSMTSTDEGLKQLLEGEFVRPFHELIYHSELGCLCCAFILAVVDLKTPPESKTAFVRVSGTLFSDTEDTTKDYLSTLVLNDSRFKICYQSATIGIPIILYDHWQAYAIEGNDSASFLVAKADHKYTPESLLLQRVQAQIHECQEKHQHCPKLTTNLPTRVIRVGSEGENPALHLSLPFERDSYLALSYCWGGPQKVVTTLASLQSMRNGISLDSLPKTIQDAITLTRRLGFKYLWVDALCIVQDNEADKIAEINAMGTVFKNATLTIAAGSAAGASKGFLDEIPQLHNCSVPFKLPNGKVGSMAFVMRLKSPPYPNPLDTRAWTLQEAMMSSRILYFGRMGVQWECRSSHWDLILDQNAEVPSGPRLPSHLFPDRHEAGKLSDFALAKAWKTLVEDYSGRALSVPTDRLPALAGIAGEIQKSFGEEDVYLAGMWKSYLINQLGWYKRCDSRPNRHESRSSSSSGRSDCPSWSWISVTGAVSFDDVHHKDAVLVDCNTCLAHDDAPLGRVCGGTLVLRAQMVQMSWATRKSLSRRSKFHIDSGQSKGDHQHGNRYLLLGRTRQRLAIGLILQSTDDRHFVRIGQLKIPNTDVEKVWPKECGAATVTII
ncbi:uncharacterized protein PAC_17603 [Phialocephala subalpina]|uniref:Heterokaryon incompatibility domain-containing protein n=1 Tax=Phialocephala subalpina TaxID=576137 RepID=A0A1L7XRN5_9HELO|nr:uncharacterized protein PAC_17603 [Phialocephala subalpina]